MADDIIFDGQEDIENWEPVDSPSPSQQEYNEYDLEFVDVETLEEGQTWIGTYTGNRFIGEAQSPSHIFDNDEDELSYAFPNHVQLRTQVADTDLEDHQSRSENPVEVGETVAIVYKGTQEVDDRPMDMHVWELRRPPE